MAEGMILLTTALSARVSTCLKLQRLTSFEMNSQMPSDARMRNRSFLVISCVLISGSELTPTRCASASPSSKAGVT